MRWIALLLGTLVLFAWFAYAQGGTSPLEAVKLLERLSAEGVNVTAQIKALNIALEMYRANKSEEAESIVQKVIQELREYERELPDFLFQKWLRTGATVTALLVTPPLFYYFFPRVYALAWAYTRRRWIVRRKVVKSDSRR